MFATRPLHHTIRAARAIATNQVARLSPGAYVSLTGETGRGRAPASAAEVANYFRTCFDDYARQLGMSPGAFAAWLEGRHVLEYGPGDVPGMGLLLIAHGAQSVTCVDRFPLVRMSAHAISILEAILDGLQGDALARARAAFSTPGDVRSGFAPHRLQYAIRPDGLSGARGTMDLVISRAVLEHVNDLEGTFRDMASALSERGIAVHQVDLKSHGLHESNPLDFLTWPAWLWTAMYSHKGVPNRERPGAYRAAIAAAGLRAVRMEPTSLFSAQDVAAVRPRLAARFGAERDEDLRWQGIWMVLDRPGAQAGRP